MAESEDKILGSGELETSGEITIISPNGFHARPAAILVKTAKKFKSEINLVKGDMRANAKSLVAVMGFTLQYGDTVAVEAKGPDAAEAMAGIVPILSGELEAADASHAAPPKPPKGDGAERKPPEDGTAGRDGKRVFRGITASPGIVTGIAKRVSRVKIQVSETAGDSPEKEGGILRDAISKAVSQIKAIEAETRSAMGESNAAIFGAHAELLEDPELMEYALKLIATGRSAAYAWQSSYEAHVKRFKGLSSEIFMARATDLEDVGARVLRILTGAHDDADLPEGSIVLAVDLTPSDTASMRGRVRGFCTVKGGATSHIAILARSLELPAIVGMDEAIMGVPDGTPLILDADGGVLTPDPGEEEIAGAKRRQAELAKSREDDFKEASRPAVTSDGVKIEVAANIGGVSEAKGAVEYGCDGVGLLRSEFLFLGRESEPSEEEQAEAYAAIARTMGRDRPLIVRTMDIGGDKPLPYIQREHEENPFLGVRGLRLSLRMKDMFRTQVRAILRASDLCDLHIMFPMVSTVEEFREAKSFVVKMCDEVGSRGVKIGLMIEVPAAAILAGHFAAEADFLSIGTNDLTQYTMAADRGDPRLAAVADCFSPAVLAMIKHAVNGAKEHGCWVGVCGGMAGETLAAPALIGLGVTELSVSVPAIPQIKSRVRGLSKADCANIAAHALSLATAAEVREYLASL